MTDAGREAVQRHRAALASGDLQEWRQAYPAMVGAVIEAYLRRRRQGQFADPDLEAP